MKGKMLDLYERWDESGHLEVKLKAISEMISKRATQKQIAEYLGITEKMVSIQYNEKNIRKLQ